MRFSIMKKITISAVLATLTAGAITLWYAAPVKTSTFKELSKKVRPAKREKNTENNDPLFI